MSVLEKIRSAPLFETPHNHPLFCYGSLVYALTAYTAIVSAQFFLREDIETEVKQLWTALLVNLFAELPSFCQVSYNAKSDAIRSPSVPISITSTCFIVGSIISGVIATIAAVLINENTNPSEVVLDHWLSAGPAIAVLSLKFLGMVAASVYKEDSASDPTPQDQKARCDRFIGSFNKGGVYFLMIVAAVDIFFNPNCPSLLCGLSYVGMGALLLCIACMRNFCSLNYTHLFVLLWSGVNSAAYYGNTPPIGSLTAFAQYCAPWVGLVPAIFFEYMQCREKRNTEQRVPLLGTRTRAARAGGWCCTQKTRGLLMDVGTGTAAPPGSAARMHAAL